MGYESMQRGGRKTKNAFLTAILCLGMLVVGLVIGGVYLNSAAPAVDTAKFTAGSSFAPGESQKVYGVDTKAYLDGFQQKVQATNPPDAWKNAFPGGKCVEVDGSQECSANAPGTLEIPATWGYRISSVVGGFGIAGGIGGLMGIAMLGWLFWTFINEIGEN